MPPSRRLHHFSTNNSLTQITEEDINDGDDNDMLNSPDRQRSIRSKPPPVLVETGASLLSFKGLSSQILNRKSRKRKPNKKQSDPDLTSLSVPHGRPDPLLLAAGLEPEGEVLDRDHEEEVSVDHAPPVLECGSVLEASSWGVEEMSSIPPPAPMNGGIQLRGDVNLEEKVADLSGLTVEAAFVPPTKAEEKEEERAEVHDERPPPLPNIVPDHGLPPPPPPVSPPSGSHQHRRRISEDPPPSVVTTGANSKQTARTARARVHAACGINPDEENNNDAAFSSCSSSAKSSSSSSRTSSASSSACSSSSSAPPPPPPYTRLQPTPPSGNGIATVTVKPEKKSKYSQLLKTPQSRLSKRKLAMADDQDRLERALIKELNEKSGTSPPRSRTGDTPDSTPSRKQISSASGRRRDDDDSDKRRNESMESVSKLFSPKNNETRSQAAATDKGDGDVDLTKYHRMMKIGLPPDAIRHTLRRDGLDPTLMDKHLSPQTDGEDHSKASIPLREDPNYAKYFKMLKAKVPRQWVRKVCEVDGKDPSVLELDGDRSLSEQRPDLAPTSMSGGLGMEGRCLSDALGLDPLAEGEGEGEEEEEERESLDKVGSLKERKAATMEDPPGETTIPPTALARETCLSSSEREGSEPLAADRAILEGKSSSSPQHQRQEAGGPSPSQHKAEERPSSPPSENNDKENEGIVNRVKSNPLAEDQAPIVKQSKPKEKGNAAAEMSGSSADKKSEEGVVFKGWSKNTSNTDSLVRPPRPPSPATTAVAAVSSDGTEQQKRKSAEEQKPKEDTLVFRGWNNNNAPPPPPPSSLEKEESAKKEGGKGTTKLASILRPWDGSPAWGRSKKKKPETDKPDNTTEEDGVVFKGWNDSLKPPSVVTNNPPAKKATGSVPEKEGKKEEGKKETSVPSHAIGIAKSVAASVDEKDAPCKKGAGLVPKGLAKEKEVAANSSPAGIVARAGAVVVTEKRQNTPANIPALIPEEPAKEEEETFAEKRQNAPAKNIPTSIPEEPAKEEEETSVTFAPPVGIAEAAAALVAKKKRIKEEERQNDGGEANGKVAGATVGRKGPKKASNPATPDGKTDPPGRTSSHPNDESTSTLRRSTGGTPFVGATPSKSSSVSVSSTGTPPLKDDPEYSKYFRMLRSRVPLSCVKRILEVDGKDPKVLDLDPNKSLDCQALPDDDDNDEDDGGQTDPFGASSAGDVGGLSPKDAFAKNFQTTFHRREEELDKESPRGVRDVFDSSFRRVGSVSSSSFVGMPTTSCSSFTSSLTSSVDFGRVPAVESAATTTDVPKTIQLQRDGSGLNPASSSSAVGGAAATLRKGPSPQQSDTPSGGKKSVAASSALSAMFANRAAATTIPSPPSTQPTKDETKPKMKKEGVVSQRKAAAAALLMAQQQKESYNNNSGKSGEKKSELTEVALKDDPEYVKYFKMRKMGLPIGAVKQALMKDGKDPDILDLDPDKSLNSQRASGSSVEESNNVPLKDDPEYAKYFKMLKMGLPSGAVKQSLMKDGKDPGVADLDPEKSLSSQTKGQTGKNGPPMKSNKKIKKSPQVVRKRLFWNAIDESKLDESSLWSQAKTESSDLLLSLDGVLEYDTDEFANLFTSKKVGEKKKKDVPSDAEKTKKESSKVSDAAGKVRSKLHGKEKAKVQLIENRRNMNGSILLAKFKRDYRAFATDLDSMNSLDMGETELRALKQLLPTKDEALALRSYLPQDASPSDRETALNNLGECEKYMAAMLDVTNAAGKFDCMLYKAQFDGHVRDLERDVDAVTDACDCVRNSDKLKRLLVYILRLGNQLNAQAGGGGQTVSAITLDSLLKLHEAKAFDKKTSVLHYLVSILRKNDEEILTVKEELLPAKTAERIVVDTLSSTIRELADGLELVHEMTVEASRPTKEEVAAADGSENKKTEMEKFADNAYETLTRLSGRVHVVNEKYAELLKYFGEDESMPADVFFTTLNRFIATFESAREDVKRKEEAKIRQERMAEKRKARQSSMKLAQKRPPAQE